MEERKATANKGFRLLQTQTGGSGSRQWLESRNKEEIPSLEMKGGSAFETVCKEVKRAGPGMRVQIGAPSFTTCGISSTLPNLSESPGITAYARKCSLCQLPSIHSLSKH